MSQVTGNDLRLSIHKAWEGCPPGQDNSPAEIAAIDAMESKAANWDKLEALLGKEDSLLKLYRHGESFFDIETIDDLKHILTLQVATS